MEEDESTRFGEKPAAVLGQFLPGRALVLVAAHTGLWFRWCPSDGCCGEVLVAHVALVKKKKIYLDTYFKRLAIQILINFC